MPIKTGTRGLARLRILDSKGFDGFGFLLKQVLIDNGAGGDVEGWAGAVFARNLERNIREAVPGTSTDQVATVFKWKVHLAYSSLAAKGDSWLEPLPANDGLIKATSVYHDSYNPGVTYGQGDAVRVGTAWKISLIDGNVGHPVSDVSKWQGARKSQAIGDNAGSSNRTRVVLDLDLIA